MSAKEAVIDIVSKLPEDSTMSDILYELYVRQEIEEGLREIDEGKVITHEEAMQRLSRWLS